MRGVLGQDFPAVPRRPGCRGGGRAGYCADPELGKRLPFVASEKVVGLALFVYFARQAGLDEIAEGIRRLSWVFILVVLLGGLRLAARAMAWRSCLQGQHRLSPGMAFRAVVAGAPAARGGVAFPYLSAASWVSVSPAPVRSGGGPPGPVHGAGFSSSSEALGVLTCRLGGAVRRAVWASASAIVCNSTRAAADGVQSGRLPISHTSQNAPPYGKSQYSVVFVCILTPSGQAFNETPPVSAGLSHFRPVPPCLL